MMLLRKDLVSFQCLYSEGFSYSIRKGADVEKAELLIRRPPRGIGEIN